MKNITIRCSTNNNKNGIRYTNEFKIKIIGLYNSGIPISHIAKTYGVSIASIYSWIQRSKTESNSVTIEDYLTLKDKITKLEQENEILKKVAAIFAVKQYAV